MIEALLLAYGTNVIDSVEFAVFMMQTVQESYFLPGNSTNLTLTTGTTPSAERNYDSAKQTSYYVPVKSKLQHLPPGNPPGI